VHAIFVHRNHAFQSRAPARFDFGDIGRTVIDALGMTLGPRLC